MSKIAKIESRKILDCLGKETIEVTVGLKSGIMAKDSVPSGTSTGAKEAKTVGADLAIANIKKIASEIVGKEASSQEEIDKTMLELDGTSDKSGLGANAILGVSLAVARAAALEVKTPLFRYLNQKFALILGQEIQPKLPTPMMVVICGGKHGSNVGIQEFLVIVQKDIGLSIRQQLEKIVKEDNIVFSLGPEGGLALKISTNEEALELIKKAAGILGLVQDRDFRLGLDIAGSNFTLSLEQTVKLFSSYDLFSLEDPFDENDWENFKKLKQRLDAFKKPYLLVGDDLFATHKEWLKKGIAEKAANAIIIKPNQIGSLTETLEVAALARRNNFTYIISHRSGETSDSFIADLAVGTAAEFIKAGAPIQKERQVKYQRLEEIKKEL